MDNFSHWFIAKLHLPIVLSKDRKWIQNLPISCIRYCTGFDLKINWKEAGNGSFLFIKCSFETKEGRVSFKNFHLERVHRATMETLRHLSKQSDVNFFKKTTSYGVLDDAVSNFIDVLDRPCVWRRRRGQEWDDIRSGKALIKYSNSLDVRTSKLCT